VWEDNGLHQELNRPPFLNLGGFSSASVICTAGTGPATGTNATTCTPAPSQAGDGHGAVSTCHYGSEPGTLQSLGMCFLVFFWLFLQVPVGPVGCSLVQKVLAQTVLYDCAKSQTDTLRLTIIESKGVFGLGFCMMLMCCGLRLDNSAKAKLFPLSTTLRFS